MRLYVMDMCSFVAACSTWQLVVVGVSSVLCHCCILLMVYIVNTAVAIKKMNTRLHRN